MSRFIDSLYWMAPKNETNHEQDENLIQILFLNH